jgi:AraC-like DNA-binding protein
MAAPPGRRLTDTADLVRLRQARDQMDRDYAEPLDVAALARTALMSPGHFSRSFRSAFGETPYSYLMTRRIERAKALLRRGDLTVTDVCFAVGCTSLGSFSSRFTELVGESPSSYRARPHDGGAAIPACFAKIVTRPVRPLRSGSAGSGSARSGSARSGSAPSGSARLDSRQRAAV